MAKAELIAALSDQSGESKATCDRVLQSLVAHIQSSVAANVPVHIAGLGTFKQVARAERQGRNPQTGEAVVVPACLSPKFQAASAFKASMPEPARAKRAARKAKK